MPVKKKQKKTVKSKPKSRSLEQTVAKLTSHLGNIEKIVKPKEKEVRVKTFIVEKPVYIPSDRKFPARGYEEKEEPVYDSRRSRYLKKKDNMDDNSLDDKETEYNDDLTEQESEENISDDSADFDDNADQSTPLDGEEEQVSDEFSEEEVLKKHKHPRAGITSILSVWWKRAIVFGIIWWLLVLAFIMILQAFNLVTVDINRGWWIFLGIIVALSMVYQKFLSGKV